MTVIFRTIHGSRLYGLNHAKSDEDLMVVYDDERTALHVHRGQDDTVHVGFNDFLNKALSGSHQSLEALFSPFKEWEQEQYRPFLEGIIVPVAGIREKYVRTIKRFSFGDFKLRRHAVRLAYSLVDLQKYGRFNPRLSPERVKESTQIAWNLYGNALRLEIRKRLSQP